MGRQTSIPAIASQTIIGIARCATPAEAKSAGASSGRFVSPEQAKNLSGHAKFWVSFNGAGTIQASYNVASVTRNGVGDFTVTLTTAFTSAEWCAMGYGQYDSATVRGVVMAGNNSTYVQTASSIRFQTMVHDSATAVDPRRMWVCGFGDQI